MNLIIKKNSLLKNINKDEHTIVSILTLIESTRIRTVPEYGYSRYIRNHKSYKKIVF